MLNMEQHAPINNRTLAKAKKEKKTKKGSSGASDRKNETETKIGRMNELILSKHTLFFCTQQNMLKE